MSYTALKNAKMGEKIDYIAYSQAQNLEFDYPPFINGDWKDINPLPHYTNGQENTQGVRRFWNNINDQQGKLTILSGQPCTSIAAFQLEFLEWANTKGRKVTRIDYALDIIHSKFTPALVRQHLKRGEAVTHAKSLGVNGDLIDGADTQYIGRKSSETYTKVYDKSVEQKTNFAWVRIETTYQGERASPSVSEYLKHQSTRPLIKSHVDFPKWQDWQAIMGAETVKLSLPLKEKGTRAWLIGQVCKVIAKELLMSDGKEFWSIMQEQILLEIERIKEGV